MVEGDVLAQPTDDDLLAHELRRHPEAPAPREMVASRLTVRVSSMASTVRRSGGAARRETAEADTVSHGRSRHTRVPYVTCHMRRQKPDQRSARSPCGKPPRARLWRWVVRRHDKRMIPLRQEPQRVAFSERLRQTLHYLGPGFFVTIGFIDPGNWATNVVAGSEFGYRLLWVVTLSTLILILWQHIAAHLGLVTGQSLAEAVHAWMRPASALLYGATAVAACVATAIAELLGAAVGLQILVGVPMRIGAFAALAGVGMMLWFQRARALERLILGFVTAIGLCYLVELLLVRPDWGQAVTHLLVPELSSRSLLIAMGVLGAVVMPHNLYLHSDVVRSRLQEVGAEPTFTLRRLLRYEFLDTLLAMLTGLLINAAMIIVAAAVFHRHGIHVQELPQAAATLRPIVGPLASSVFGLGLLFAGLASALTVGLAGGTIFSSYLGKSTDAAGAWSRAGVLLTLVPACLLILLVQDVFRALILSQVCLSIQLPLTMLPLFILTTRRRVMGGYTTGWLETAALVLTGVVVLGLNAALVWQLTGA